jgi:thiol-disulfide isomerase/thioredoxin
MSATVPESHEPPVDTSSAAPAPQQLEGEDKAALVGIMYSDKVWIVPGWIKTSFFWVAIVGLIGVFWFEADKRVTFRTLLIDSVVEPEDIGSAMAPPWSLPPGESGAPVDLAAYKGKWVFVNFWATWCPPCRDEMPSMEMLNRRFQGKNLAMVAITVDENWAEVNRFFGDTKPSFTVLWDRDKRVSSTYSTRKFPESYLIDPEGRVAAKFVGPRDWYNQATVQYFEDVIAGKRKPVS